MKYYIFKQILSHCIKLHHNGIDVLPIVNAVESAVLNDDKDTNFLQSKLLTGCLPEYRVWYNHLKELSSE